MIHFIKDDAGVNSIATIVTFSGDPDLDQVIYLLSARWGSQQTLMVLLYVVVLFRYRNLLPLMYVLLVLEFVFRLLVGVLHPLTVDHMLRTAPRAYETLGGLLVVTVLLTLSLRSRSRNQGFVPPVRHELA